MAGPTPSLEEVVVLLRNLQTETLFTAAGTAIYVYDYFLTLGDEIDVVWGSPWSLVKCLFLLNRYLTPFVLVLLNWDESGLFRVSQKQCDVFLYIIQYLIVALLSIWDAIMCIRVWALWGKCRKIASLCILLWTTFVVVATTLVTREAQKMEPNTSPLDVVRVCSFGTRLTADYWAVWVPDLVLEFLIFSLAMVKLVKTSTLTPESLGALLIRDGVLWFSLVFFGRLACLGLFLHRDASIAFVVVTLMAGLASASMSRLVINLRTWHRSRNPVFIMSPSLYLDPSPRTYTYPQVPNVPSRTSDVDFLAENERNGGGDHRLRYREVIELTRMSSIASPVERERRMVMSRLGGDGRRVAHGTSSTHAVGSPFSSSRGIRVFTHTEVDDQDGDRLGLDVSEPGSPVVFELSKKFERHGDENVRWDDEDGKAVHELSTTGSGSYPLPPHHHRHRRESNEDGHDPVEYEEEGQEQVIDVGAAAAAVRRRTTFVAPSSPLAQPFGGPGYFSSAAQDATSPPPASSTSTTGGPSIRTRPGTDR